MHLPARGAKMVPDRILAVVSVIPEMMMDDLQLGLFTTTRVLHVATATVLVGGVFFMRFVLGPAASDSLTDEQHDQLRTRLMQGWKKFVHAGIGVLLISGGINYARAIMAIRASGMKDGLYHGLMGTKILLALVLFFIASALVGRSPAFAKMREHRRKWMVVMLALALLIYSMSGFLRVRKGPAAVAAPTKAVAADGER